MVRFKFTILLIFFCLSHLPFVPPFQTSFGMVDKVGKKSNNDIEDLNNTIDPGLI